MDTILQGTTPTLIIELDSEDVSVDNVAQLELVFHQIGHNYLVKTLNDCELDSETNTVSYHFTEEETLSFTDKKPLVYQMRVKTTDGEIIGTGKTEVEVIDLMRNAVMGE